MGYSMRTDRYRYTEWIFYDDITYRPLWERNRLYAELYDGKTDPEENNNVAEDQRYVAVRKQLRQQLRDGWRGALPRKSTASYSELWMIFRPTKTFLDPVRAPKLVVLIIRLSIP